MTRDAWWRMLAAGACFAAIAVTGCQPEDGFDEGGDPAGVGEEEAGTPVDPPPPQRGGPHDGETGDLGGRGKPG